MKELHIATVSFTCEEVRVTNITSLSLLSEQKPQNTQEVTLHPAFLKQHLSYYLFTVYRFIFTQDLVTHLLCYSWITVF